MSESICSYFADLLQDRNGHLEVADMECRQCQPEMPEMAVARIGTAVASRTLALLGRAAHAPIERAIFNWITLLIPGFKLVETIVD